MGTMLAIPEAFALAAWTWAIVWAGAWLALRVHKAWTWTRDQRNREALFLATFSGKGRRP